MVWTPPTHCIVCGKAVGVVKDGTINTHGYGRTWKTQSREYCAGSRIASLETVARELSEALATAPMARIRTVLADFRSTLGAEATDRLHNAALALLD